MSGSVSLIKADKFSRALDMRDKLPDVMRNKTARKTFFDATEPRGPSRRLSQSRKSAEIQTPPISDYRDSGTTSQPARRKPKSPSYCGARVRRAGLNTS